MDGVSHLAAVSAFLQHGAELVQSLSLGWDHCSGDSCYPQSFFSHKMEKAIADFHDSSSCLFFWQVKACKSLLGRLCDYLPNFCTYVMCKVHCGICSDSVQEVCSFIMKYIF